MSLLKSVAHSEFVRSIPPALIGRLNQIASAREYAPGTTLFTEGAKNDEFHVVVEGQVRLDMLVTRRGRIPILTAEAGDILAWSALFGESSMTASAVALVPVKTIAFRGEQLRELCEAEHEIGYHVMRQLACALSRRLVATRLQLLDLFADQAPVLQPAALGKPGDDQC
jgi:CRP-like cAMP-binding protein